MLKKLLLLAALVCFAAAGRASALELTYWAPFSGGDGDYMKEMVDSFNAAHPDTKVTMLNLKSEEYYAKFRTAAVTGRGPDIAIAHVSQLAGLTADNLIVPLDDLAPGAGLDWADFADSVVDAAVLGGRHMAVPLDTHTVIMYYNKKMLGDAGLLKADGSPALEPGMDGFMKFAAALKAKLPADVAPVAFSMEGAMPYWIWWGLYRQNGGNLLSADGKTAKVVTPEAKEPLDFILRLVDQGIIPRGVKMCPELFKAKKLAVVFDGIWVTGDFGNTAGLDFGVAPLPRVYASEGAWADAHTFAVVRQRSRDAEKETACLRFIDWVTEHSLPWGRAGQIPARKAISSSAEYAALPNRADPAKLIDIARFLPNSEKINAVREISMMHVNAAVVGQQTPEESLNRMEAEINRELAR